MTHHRHTPATLPIPIRALAEPRDYELCNQTLMGVPIADAPAAALARWREKQARRRGDRDLPRPFGQLHRVVGSDGVTRWFDDTSRIVARSTPRECDRCQVIRLNRDLARPRSWTWLRTLLAVIAIASTAFALIARHLP